MADLRALPADLKAVIEAAISQIDNASILIEADMITPDEWQLEMAGIIDRFHQEAAEVGAAGADVTDLTGTINQLVAIQLAFLENFTADIEGNDWLAGYVSRAQMYGSALKAAYWHGEVIQQVGRVLPLPAMPGEGTQCLCITTPESRVFTEFGYVPIGDVKPGTMVLTHKLRWRQVLRSVVSLSTTQDQVIFYAPGGKVVGCTQNHRWFSRNGWLAASLIGHSYQNHESRQQIYVVREETMLKKRFGADIKIDLGDNSYNWNYYISILYMGHLAPDTPLYDIEVEEDHSFIIEGMISHNSNCKCRWRIVTLDAANGDYNAFWEKSPVDNCQTCIERDLQWAPVQIRGGELVAV